MPIGVFLALMAYGSYSMGDAIIKGLGGSLSVYEIIVFTTLFSTVPVYIAKPKEERLRDILKTTRPGLVHLRALLGVCSTILVVFGFTTIPLAEVYALVFLTPIIVSVLSVFILKESMTPQRWFFLALGFLGVILVVRPGFRHLELGHFAAMACTLFASTGAIILRQVSQTEKRITIVGYGVIYALGVNFVLMIPSFVMPNMHEWIALIGVGTVAGMGHTLIISAARNAPANLVAPAQYSQIIWAIVLGAVFYHEYPDAISYVGLTIVVGAGIAAVVPVRARTWFGVNLVPHKRKRVATVTPGLHRPALGAGPEPTPAPAAKPPTR